MRARATRVVDLAAQSAAPTFGGGRGRAALRSRETHHAATSSSRYQDFENGRTGLLLSRLRLFAEIPELDRYAIHAAFLLGKPRVAHVFAHNKLMLIQASAVDEFSAEVQDAVAAVDPLTALDGHMQLYRQLAELGRAELRATRGRRDEP